MRIRWHYYCSYDENLVSFLHSHNISAKITYGYQDETMNIPSLLSFDIYEDHSAFPFVVQQLNGICEGIPSIDYTDDDLNSAQFLTMRGGTMRLDLTNETESFYCTEYIDKTRARHRYRTGTPLFAEKPVKWGTRQFFCCAYTMGENYLFCNDFAKHFLTQHNCPVQFEPILHGKTRQAISNLFFLHPTEVISSQYIRWNRGAHTLTCPECGAKQIDYGNDFQLHLSKEVASTMGNFFQTEAIFGGGNFLSPINIISQELYQAMKAASITNNLIFAPIRLL